MVEVQLAMIQIEKNIFTKLQLATTARALKLTRSSTSTSTYLYQYVLFVICNSKMWIFKHMLPHFSNVPKKSHTCIHYLHSIFEHKVQ